MTSLFTIAELAWRNIYPEGSREARNTLEEFVETAVHEYAYWAFRMHMELVNSGEESMVEGLLRRKGYAVKTDEEGLYSDLDVDVMDLPKDIGVYQVWPSGSEYPLTKGKDVSRNLFPEGERIYFRREKQIRYPDGFERPNTKTVFITTISLDSLDEKLEVPDTLAKQIRDSLERIYGQGKGLGENTTNNKNTQQ